MTVLDDTVAPLARWAVTLRRLGIEAAGQVNGLDKYPELKNAVYNLFFWCANQRDVMFRDYEHAETVGASESYQLMNGSHLYIMGKHDNSTAARIILCSDGVIRRIWEYNNHTEALRALETLSIDEVQG